MPTGGQVKLSAAAVNCGAVGNRSPYIRRAWEALLTGSRAPSTAETRLTSACDAAC